MGAKRVFIFGHTIRRSEGVVVVDGKPVARDVAVSARVPAMCADYGGQVLIRFLLLLL